MNHTGYNLVREYLKPREFKELIKDLYSVQKDMKKEYHTFPDQCCSTAAKKIYDRLGFFPAGGKFMGLHHSWNYMNDKPLLVDITLHQFEKYYPSDLTKDIIVLPIHIAKSSYGYKEVSGTTEFMIDQMTKKKGPGADFRAMIASRHK